MWPQGLGELAWGQRLFGKVAAEQAEGRGGPRPSRDGEYVAAWSLVMGRRQHREVRRAGSCGRLWEEGQAFLLREGAGWLQGSVVSDD